MSNKPPEDPRHAARREELERQATVNNALAKHEAQARAEAEEALRRQGVYEVTGVRVVEGKP